MNAFFGPLFLKCTYQM